MLSILIKRALNTCLPAIYFTIMPFSAKAEIGFRKSVQIEKASPLQIVAKSVFQVTVPAGDKLNLDLKKYPTVELAVASTKDYKDLNEPELILRKRTINNCLKKKLEMCPIFSTFEIGTIFLIENSQTAVGAFHVFRDFLSGESKPVELILQNQDGKIVFGSAEHELATVAYAHADAYKTEKRTSPIFDFIQLKFPHSLGLYKPLAINYEYSYKPGETVYHIGFPGPTYDRKKNYGKPDSDGISQYITKGSSIDLPAYLHRIGKDIKDINPDVLNILDQATFYTEADSYFGMSGGPTLNENGEIIGLVIGSYPVDGAASDVKTSASIKSRWALKLMTGQ